MCSFHCENRSYDVPKKWPNVATPVSAWREQYFEKCSFMLIEML